MTKEETIKILQKLSDNKTDELAIMDDEGGAVCADIIADQDALNVAIKALKEERPHGEWIAIPKYKRRGKRFFDCSVCHYGKNGEIICEISDSKIPNFCPNCGADMRPRVLDQAVDGEGKDGNVKEGDEK